MDSFLTRIANKIFVEKDLKIRVTYKLTIPYYLLILLSFFLFKQYFSYFWTSIPLLLTIYTGIILLIVAPMVFTIILSKKYTYKSPKSSALELEAEPIFEEFLAKVSELKSLGNLQGQSEILFQVLSVEGVVEGLLTKLKEEPNGSLRKFIDKELREELFLMQGFTKIFLAHAETAETRMSIVKEVFGLLDTKFTKLRHKM